LRQGTVIKEEESVRLLYSGYNRIIINDKSKEIRKKVAKVYFEVISQNLPRRTQESNGKFQSG
jgi:hypothetical protein